MNQALDKAGKPIYRGNFVVYGHALGLGGGLRFGRIVSIKEMEADLRGNPVHHFMVRSIADDDGGPPSLNKRHSTLLFSERILVISRDILPDYYRILLSDLPELLLTCQDCKKTRQDVSDTTCPYSREVNETELKIRVCSDCYHERVLSV